jgi:hypothetical protein
VYDASGDSFGEAFVQNLTLMIFEELRDTNVEPVLLNPGGAYSPDGVEWIADYAQRLRVDAALITVLQRSDRPKHGDWSLRVESQLYLMRSSRRGLPTLHAQTMQKRDIQRGLESGGYSPSRPFEKQPLGKAARRFARSIKDTVVAEARAIPPDGPPLAKVHSGRDSCTVSFRISYSAPKAASKSYTLLVNDREESLGIKDGVANLDLASGPIVVQATVNDAPYKLPVEGVYIANTRLDCRQPERILILEIGPAGEAFLTWR